MVYLVKDNDKVRVFYSESDMKAAGFKKAGLRFRRRNSIQTAAIPGS
jgi:hypothetical protein